MNNKEFTQELSKRTGCSIEETQDLIEGLIDVMSKGFQEGMSSVTIQSFGAFEVKKKMERISVNPSTQKRMLIPPKLVLNFRPSNKLKETVKG
jgi:DNA-binding protein HU-beta